jgi:RimJ/RimL family protein N-acetyltransferase
MTSPIILRDVIEADLQIFYLHQLDPEATRMAAFPARDREAFMAHWKKILVDETNVLKTIVYEEQVVGNIVSFLMEGKREVGYWIGREYWGHGIATRALELFLEQIRQRPLYAYVDKHNIGSYRVLEKCGFVRAGEHDEDYILRLDAAQEEA